MPESKAFFRDSLSKLWKLKATGFLTGINSIRAWDDQNRRNNQVWVDRQHKFADQFVEGKDVDKNTEPDSEDGESVSYDLSDKVTNVYVRNTEDASKVLNPTAPVSPVPTSSETTFGQKLAILATAALLPVAGAMITWAAMNRNQPDDYVNQPGIYVTTPDNGTDAD